MWTVQSYLPGGASVFPILYAPPCNHPSPQAKHHLNWLSCFCAAHGKQSLYFTMGRPSTELPIGMGISTPVSCMVPCSNPSPQPKLHLDWFICFCRAQNRDRLTDRPIDKPCCSVCNSRPHLLTSYCDAA